MKNTIIILAIFIMSGELMLMTDVAAAVAAGVNVLLAAAVNIDTSEVLMSIAAALDVSRCDEKARFASRLDDTRHYHACIIVAALEKVDMETAQSNRLTIVVRANAHVSVPSTSGGGDFRKLAH